MMLSMIDFPTPDYETKKDKKKKAKKGFGTPINELDKETQNQIRK